MASSISTNRKESQLRQHVDPRDARTLRASILRSNRMRQASLLQEPTKPGIEENTTKDFPIAVPPTLSNNNPNDSTRCNSLAQFQRKSQLFHSAILRSSELLSENLGPIGNYNVATNDYDPSIMPTSPNEDRLPNVIPGVNVMVPNMRDISIAGATSGPLNIPAQTGSSFVVRSRRRKISERWGFGPRSITCSYCKALMWIEEKVENSAKSNPRFSLCCQRGQVILPLLPLTPDFLEQKFKDRTFKEHIRAYNSMLSFTSMGGKIDHSMSDGRGPYSFQISGENVHRIGSLLPEPGKKPTFAQLYIYDTEHEVHNRMDAITTGGHASGIDVLTLEALQNMLNDINPYVKIFRNARDKMSENNVRDLKVQIIQSRGGRQYIRPTTNEIAALIVGDGTEDVGNRDIVVCKSDGTLQRIDETHPSYMPLQYPILFPLGTDGWCRCIPFAPGSSNSREGVSMRQFYAFRLQHRDGEGKTILQGGRLFQQFVVDCYAAIEQHRLTYVKLNQDRLRSDLYRDAMAICRAMGPPDFFITFTCNPNWKEIQHELSRIPGQRVDDRPDIVARVFRIKHRQLMSDFKKKSFLGRVVADIHVIEFQKRGLPHAHILLTLAAADKPVTVEDIDDVICAEIPDQREDPLAYETVIKCMIHGPCGVENPNAPCMVNGKCSKHYPKEFCNQTTIDENGFVKYRRGVNVNKIVVNGRTIDNRWVIPYNRDLLVRYDAHINIERCAQTKLIKYLYKYMHKGVDSATTVVEENVLPPGNVGQQRYKDVDEVKQYLDCRYISAIESCWRIFDFDLQQQYPSVKRLQYHLSGEQFIVFPEAANVQSVVERPGVQDTMFTKWFEANRNHPEARVLTYADFPGSWVWDRKQKKWTERKQRKVIGRLLCAHPTSGERYYLRMLLNKVRGATCYEDIRTVNGVVHQTFKEACLELGLLDDDNEWHEALAEASIWASGLQLRNMFCSMLMFSEVTSPHELWENHWNDLTNDLQIRVRRHIGDNEVHLDEEELRNLGLHEIEQILNRNGRSLKDFPHMPLPSSHIVNVIINRLIREELDYDSIREKHMFESLHAGLNSDQLQIFDAIMTAHTKQEGGPFFIYAHCLQLKVGAPIVLLRNINQFMGLYNGTRLIIHKLGDRVIEARVITGSNMDGTVLIPRIELSPSTTHWPFMLKRRQFPVKLAFAMTINKSQGQTLTRLDMRPPINLCRSARLEIRRMFKMLECKCLREGTPVRKHGFKKIRMGWTLREFGYKVPDQYLMDTILKTLPSSWDIVKGSVLQEHNPSSAIEGYIVDFSIFVEAVVNTLPRSWPHVVSKTICGEHPPDLTTLVKVLEEVEDDIILLAALDEAEQNEDMILLRALDEVEHNIVTKIQATN
ncbi:hypothetical protein L1049_014360 [Liquidambar formosana]|uniref:ATP-dependent DNA helicase n=1 Tax=Liquidambar formosana TaxID=63359 RepID=A0AAP0RN58_LIQFO